MENLTRTEYSARNTAVALISKIIAILMGYAVRVVFTSALSASYVGVSGLFMDIVTVLSLSELGIETAITYALYQPIAYGDIEKQKSVIALFQKLYRVFALGVGVIGLVLILVIKDAPILTFREFLFHIREHTLRPTDDFLKVNPKVIGIGIVLMDSHIIAT